MVSTNASAVLGPTPGWASATSPADADRQPAAPLDPAYRSAALTSPAAPVSPAVGRPPRVSAAARAATAVRPGSTAGASSAFPYSEKGVAVRFLPGCGLSPACAGAAPTAADRAAPGPASTGAENVLPPPASECGLHPACPSSACARNWPGSRPHLR